MTTKTKSRKIDEDVLKRVFGSWKDAGISDSVKYVRDIRKGWEKRMKRLGIK